MEASIGKLYIAILGFVDDTFDVDCPVYVE